MNAGLLFQWYRLEFMAQPTVSYDLTEHDADGGWLQTRYTDMVLGPTTGLEISASVTPDGDIRNYTCKIPGLAINWTRTEVGAGGGTFNTQVVFENLRCYTLPTYGFALVWDNIRWYTAGTLRQSSGSGSATNYIFKPSGIPIIGAIGPTLIAECKADTAAIATSAFTGGSTVSVSGGWRFKEKSTDGWQSPSAICGAAGSYFTTAPSCVAPSPSAGTLPSVTNTYNATVHASLSVSGGTGGYTYADEYHSQITIVANLPRIFERLNPDYGALWYRFGMPQSSVLGSWACTPYDEEGNALTGTSGTSSTEILAHQSEMLSFVTNAPHVIEDPLSQDLYCPWRQSAFKQVANSGVMVGMQAISATYPVIGTETGVPAIYQSTDDTLEYGDTWCNPFWSYLYFFPATDEENPSANDWTIDGSAVHPNFGWLPWRVQWMHHTALPEAENTHQRNFIVETPGLDGGYSDWIESNLFANAKTHWVGIPGFKTVVPDVPASVTIDSDNAACWTGANCTLTHGSSITATPTGGATEIVIEHDLGRFDAKPWMALHLMNQFKPNWSLTNVASVKSYAVSVDGTTKKLFEASAGDGFTTRNTTYDIPRVTDAKFAGSWANDYGVGIVTDQGTDLLASGISSATVADPERNAAFSLLGGSQPAKIRYEVTLTSSAAFTLNYPVFYFTKSATVLQENSHWSNLIYPDGPGVRLGQWSWWNGSSLRTTPNVTDIGSQFVVGYRQTALDALVTKRVLLEGKANDDGLNTELGTLFDSVEGNTRADADSFAYAFHLPAGESIGGDAGVIAITNSFACVPALCMFPRKKLSADYAETGGYGQYQYTYCQLNRRIANASNPMHLTVGGTQWTALSSLSVGGWSITEHSHAVDNTENGKLLLGTNEMASVRPWWGWLSIAGQSNVTAYDVANIHLAMGQYMRALATDDGAVVSTSLMGDPSSGWWNTTTAVAGTIKHVHLVRDSRDNACILLASDDVTCHQLRSFDLGKTWVTESTMTGVKFEKGAESPMHFKVKLGLVESSMTLKGEIVLPGTLTPTASFTVKTDSGSNLVLEEDPFDISFSLDYEALVLTCKASGEAEHGEWLSWDYGRTFKKV